MAQRDVWLALGDSWTAPEDETREAFERLLVPSAVSGLCAVIALCGFWASVAGVEGSWGYPAGEVGAKLVAAELGKALRRARKKA